MPDAAPVVYIPDEDELVENLADAKTLKQRIAYVRSVLVDAAAVGRGVDNLNRQVEDLEASKVSMAAELRALRQKLGDLPPGERAALDARYEMLGQIKRARGSVDRFETTFVRDAQELIRELREALAPPKRN